MPTECTASRFEFELLERRKVVADFRGGTITSDADALLLGQLDRGLGPIERFAGGFEDGRKTLVGQRIFAIALGYEDLNDHDKLRHDPLFHVLAGCWRASSRDHRRARLQLRWIAGSSPAMTPEDVDRIAPLMVLLDVRQ